MYILDKEEIRELWKDVEPIISGDAISVMTYRRKIKLPRSMSNGYMALLTLDIHKDNQKEFHLSISNPFGIPNFETAAAMAREILGECDQLDVGFRGVYHFVKEVTIDNKSKDKGETE